MRTATLATAALLLFLLAVPTLAADSDDVWDRVEHHWAKNDEVKIHYVTLGKGKRSGLACRSLGGGRVPR